MAAGTPWRSLPTRVDVAVDEGGLRAAADGAPDVGGRQGRRVVDAVADHDHSAADPAQVPEGRQLLLGAQPALCDLDAQLPGHRADRVRAVPAQDGRAQPEVVQPPDGARRLLAQGGRHGEHPDGAVVDLDDDDGLPPAPVPLRCRGQVDRERTAVCADDPDACGRRPVRSRPAPGMTATSEARSVGRCAAQMALAIGCSMSDSTAAATSRTSSVESAGGRGHRDDGGDAHGEGARLVEGHRVDARPAARGRRRCG